MAKSSKVSVSSPSVRMIVALDKINYDLSRNRKAGMDPESITELANNIKIHGVLQNIILNEKEDGTFEVMGGIRRTMAAKEAGLTEIPALVYKARTREDHFVIQIVENSYHNPSYIDRAKDMLRAKEEFKWTQKRVAMQFNISDSEVSNFLKLLKLPEALQLAVHNGEYTKSSAFRLFERKNGEAVSPETMADVAAATEMISEMDKSKEEKKKLNDKVLDVIDKKLADKGINSGIAPSAATKAETKIEAKIEEKKKNDLPAINLNGAAMPPKVDPKTPSSVLPPSRQPLPPVNQPTVSVTAEKREKGLSRDAIMGLLLFLEKESSGEARKFISDMMGHIDETNKCASRGDLAMILKSLEKVKKEPK